MKLYIHILFLLAGLMVSAQAPRKFYTRFGGNGYDVGYDVKQTLDNGYIITGSTSSFGQGNTDMYLVKLDSVGNKKFETSFGGYSNEIGKSVIQLIDSSYVIVGYTSSIGIGGYDIFLVKADKNGNSLWQKTIGGTEWDFAYSLQQTSDGGFIIGGTTYSFGYGNADGYVVKTDATGNVTWSKTYGGANDDEFKSVVQTADGGYALTGYTKSYNDIDSGDVWVFKLNTLGDSTWCKFYGGSKEDFGNHITQIQNTNVLIAGGTNSESVSGNQETLLLALDNSNGAVMLHYSDPSTQNEYYNHVTQALKGNIVACGKTNNGGAGTQYDGIVDMYTSTYGFLYFFSVGSLFDEELYSISNTRDKGYVAVGKTTSYGAALDDILIFKMDSLGSYGPNLTSINDSWIADLSVTIFPNPADNEVNILITEFSQYKNLKFSLNSINGTSVLGSKIVSDKTYINTTEISSGLYFLQLFDENKLINTTKISVVK